MTNKAETAASLMGIIVRGQSTRNHLEKVVLSSQDSLAEAERALSVHKDTIEETSVLLAKLGYATRSTDGVWVYEEPK